MTNQLETNWNEEEYVSYLNAERKLFAWCLEEYDDYAPAQAKQGAESFYSYEPQTDLHRGLVFHEEAWHWAMLKIIGETYWKTKPEFKSPSEQYKNKAIELHNSGMQSDPRTSVR